MHPTGTGGDGTLTLMAGVRSRHGTEQCGIGVNPSGSWTLFDPRREQVDYLSDPGRTDIRPAGGRIDPAEIGLAVELRQSIEKGARCRAGRERCGDIVGEITALRTFRGQFNGHVVADRDADAQHALRSQGQHPSTAGGHEPCPDPPAVNCAADGMVGLSTPRLIRVKRHRDDRAIPRTGGDDRAETLCEHDLYRGTAVMLRVRPAEENGVCGGS
jgi:hypothetical protein